MSTQFWPRVSDPKYFTHERVQIILRKVHDELIKCGFDTYYNEQDTLNYMYRVYRPNVSYSYMELMTIQIMVHDRKELQQTYVNNLHALENQKFGGTSSLSDPQAIRKSVYKFKHSELGSRPEVSFD